MTSLSAVCGVIPSHFRETRVGRPAGIVVNQVDRDYYIADSVKVLRKILRGRFRSFLDGIKKDDRMLILSEAPVIAPDTKSKVCRLALRESLNPDDPSTRTVGLRQSRYSAHPSLRCL